MIPGVRSSTASAASECKRSTSSVFAKSARQACNSVDRLGMGEMGAGVIKGFGLCGVVGAEVSMGGAGGLGMRWAMRAAISAEVRSGGGVAQACRGPVHPQGLFVMSRPSRSVSKLTLLGGSCLVAS